MFSVRMCEIILLVEIFLRLMSEEHYKPNSLVVIGKSCKTEEPIKVQL